MADAAMTDQQYRVLVNYIRSTADHMGLRDWQFVLEPAFLTDPPGKLAATSVWGDSKTTTMEFHSDFFTLGPLMQREVVIHEITHWHLEPPWRFVAAIADAHLSREAAAVMRTAYEQHMELSVDSISAAWARHFPVINWKSTTKLHSEVRRERPPEGKAKD